MSSLKSFAPSGLISAGLALVIASVAHAQVELAVNIDGIADWMSSAAYIDAGAFFRRWGMPGAAHQDHPGLRLTEDNLPLGDADALSYLNGYPDGIYTLRYGGSAVVNVVGAGRIVPGSQRREGKLTRADVQIQRGHAEGIVTLQVRQVNPADPLRSLQLLAPGYADASQVLRTEFLRRVRPFPTIRFMDWQQTNFNPQKRWSDRPKPSRFSRCDPRGVPVEDIIALANAVHRNVWINIPQAADDDFVRQFATTFRDGLHKDAIIHLEYSNELWNFMFPQAKDNLLAARANAKLTKPDDFLRCSQQSAFRLAQCSLIFKEVFGEAEFGRRIRPVFGGFIANSYWARAGLEWLRANQPGLVRELAVAPYFGVEGDIKDVDQPGANADVMFAKLDAWIDTRIANWVGLNARAAADHGVKLVAYEGGNHLTATNGINEDLKKQMQNDRRMAATYQRLLTVWEVNGGGLFTQFGHIAPHSKFGCWGLLEDARQRGSVKWDFFMSRLLPAGDADLDGAVTWADAQVLGANFGRTGKWWEEGDFNADGKVDAQDAAILLKNAKSLTPEQKAEIENLR